MWRQDVFYSLQWRHNGRDGVSNYQRHDCLLNRLFGRRSKKISKLRVNGLCVGNSPVTGEFPAQMASNAENISIWWRHHVHDFSRVFTGLPAVCIVTPISIDLAAFDESVANCQLQCVLKQLV